VEKALARIEASKAEVVVMVGTYEPARVHEARQGARSEADLSWLVLHGSGRAYKKTRTGCRGADCDAGRSTSVGNALLPAAEEYNSLLARYFPETIPILSVLRAL